MREHYSSGTSWEGTVGYSRAVRVDGRIYVSGTTATNASGGLVGVDDAYRQTIQIIDNIERALSELEASLEDVVRTRLYVTDIEQWKVVGRAHGERFGDIRPAATMVEVSGLVDPAMLVEMDATAVVRTCKD